MIPGVQKDLEKHRSRKLERVQQQPSTCGQAKALAAPPIRGVATPFESNSAKEVMKLPANDDIKQSQRSLSHQARILCSFWLSSDQRSATSTGTASSEKIASIRAASKHRATDQNKQAVESSG